MLVTTGGNGNVAYGFSDTVLRIDLADNGVCVVYVGLDIC